MLLVQNMNAQCAVSEMPHTSVTQKVIRRVSCLNKSRNPGSCRPAVALLGAILEFQERPGGSKKPEEQSTPTRNRHLGGAAAKTTFASPAMRMPTLTPVCSTAAIQGRHCRGQLSASSDAPMAHSPPTPKAAGIETASTATTFEQKRKGR